MVGLSGGVPRRIVALAMAFGAGALISALAYDLTEDAFAHGGALMSLSRGWPAPGNGLS
jgi:ZIP family zinc transporter